MGRITIALSLEVILLSLSIQTGESIKCYVCTSQKNTKCADPIDRSGLEPTECSKSVLEEVNTAVRNGVNTLNNFFGMSEIPQGPDLKFGCQKIDMSDQSGNKHTIRACTVAKSDYVDPCAMVDSVSKRTNGQGKVDFCGTCEADLCNGASHHSFTIMSVFVVPCFAIIISRWIGV